MNARPGMSYLCSRALNHLCLIEADPPPLHCHQGAGDGHVALLVPEAAPVLAVAVGNVYIVELSAQHVVRGDHHLLLGQHVRLQKAVLLHALIHLHGFTANSTTAKNRHSDKNAKISVHLNMCKLLAPLLI